MILINVQYQLKTGRTSQRGLGRAISEHHSCAWGYRRCVDDFRLHYIPIEMYHRQGMEGSPYHGTENVAYNSQLAV